MMSIVQKNQKTLLRLLTASFKFFVFCILIVETNSALVSAQDNTDERMLGESRPLFSSPRRDLQIWFDAHVLEKDENHSCQKGLSKAISGAFAVSGAAVFVYLSYQFGNDTIKGGIPGGVSFGAVTTVSPVLGYYRLNLPYYEHLLVTQDGRAKIASKIKGWKEMSLESAMFVANFLGAIPIAYASHEGFYHLIGPVPTWILDVPTLVSIYLVYDITERDCLARLKLWYDSRHVSAVNLSATDLETDNFDEGIARRKLFVHLKKLIGAVQKLSDTRINEIYDIIHQEMEIEDRPATSDAVDPRILALLSLSSVNDAQQGSARCCSINLEDIIGYVGGIIGLVGTYYFYDMGVKSVVDMCAGVDISPHVCDILGRTAGVAIFGCRGIFSFITSQSTFQNMYGYLKNLCGRNNLTKTQKILIPTGITVLAAARAVPNVQMSFDYLGINKWYEIALGCCTGLTTFSGSFWSLKAFTDGYFRTPVQSKRAILKEELIEVVNILPYLKKEPLRELVGLLTSSGINTSAPIGGASI